MMVMMMLRLFFGGMERTEENKNRNMILSVREEGKNKNEGKKKMMTEG